ncbi:MAG: hypothetical protein R3C11_24915 [Planctomycetaceae bacterium]
MDIVYAEMLCDSFDVIVGEASLPQKPKAGLADLSRIDGISN